LLSIVVPTYKEAGNLPALVRAVNETLCDKGVDFEIIIADDNSPDDTLAVINALRTSMSSLKLIQPKGRERDLSLSVIDGISAAEFDVVLVMDADLSHPPARIIEMLSLLKENPGSFVIGSRYVKGGSFDRDWSLWRFLNSYFATALAQPLVQCSDPMSGFFMFEKSRVDMTSLRPIGYKIGLELMVRGSFDMIQEVAIDFQDRTIGESKMNLSQQFRYLRHLRRLYLHRFKGWAEFFHYGAVGASGFLVDIAFYYLLQYLGLQHQLARAVSFWPAVSWNWALNRITTFGERQRRPKTRQWLEFVITSLVGFSINWGVYATLTSTVPFFDEYRLFALVLGIVGASLFNFTVSTLFVYNDKRQ